MISMGQESHPADQESRRLQEGIRALIRQGESETLEFKESFGREAIETICAFANTKGGALLIGVNDKGDIQGAKEGASILKEWADMISQSTGLQPSIEEVRLYDSRIVRLQVPASRVKPVMYHGKAYYRSGSTTRQMSVDEMTRTVLASVGMTWDEAAEVRASMTDISTAQVKAFVKMARETGRRPIPAGISPRELLQKLKLIRQGRPTRAAILLFGKTPQKFYGQALVKVGRFRDKTLIVDDREIEGTLFDQIEGAISYCREKLDTRFVMTGKPRREVVWEYPLEALREAVINALCHRDYLSTAHVQVRICDRELLVMNPGGLPAGLSVEALKRTHHSIPRNRQIAEILYYAGLIEQWGSGIEKMMRACFTAGLPEPAFESDMAFKAIFKKAAAGQDRHGPASGTMSGLSGDQVKVLRICVKGQPLAAILAAFGRTNKTKFRRGVLAPLVAAGLISPAIPGKPRSRFQRYLTTDKGLAETKGDPPSHAR